MNARTRFSDFYDKFHDGIIPEPCHLQIHGEPPVLAVAIPEQAEYTPMTKLNMDRQDRLWPLFAYFRTRKIDMGRMMPQHVLIRKDAGDLPWNGGSLVIDLQILLVHAMDGTQEARWRDIRENYEIGRAYLDALIDRFRQSLPDGPPVIPQSFDGGKIARWMCQELDTDRGEVCLKTHASRAELEDHLRQHGVPEELIAGELVEDDYWDMETLARGPSGAASPRLRPTHTARERPPRPSKVHDSQSSSYESNTTID
ncbi:hypothetical protein MMC28_002879 [Mycoblastus sanguinarius]|nr:hypothetical protein [Mycoblastus sanguinarius]